MLDIDILYFKNWVPEKKIMNVFEGATIILKRTHNGSKNGY